MKCVLAQLVISLVRLSAYPLHQQHSLLQVHSSLTGKTIKCHNYYFSIFFVLCCLVIEALLSVPSASND